MRRLAFAVLITLAAAALAAPAAMAREPTVYTTDVPGKRRAVVGDWQGRPYVAWVDGKFTSYFNTLPKGPIMLQWRDGTRIGRPWRKEHIRVLATAADPQAIYLLVTVDRGVEIRRVDVATGKVTRGRSALLPGVVEGELTLAPDGATAVVFSGASARDCKRSTVRFDTSLFPVGRDDQPVERPAGASRWGCPTPLKL